MYTLVEGGNHVFGKQGLENDTVLKWVERKCKGNVNLQGTRFPSLGGRLEQFHLWTAQFFRNIDLLFKNTHLYVCFTKHM